MGWAFGKKLAKRLCSRNKAAALRWERGVQLNSCQMVPLWAIFSSLYALAISKGAKTAKVWEFSWG